MTMVKLDPEARREAERRAQEIESKPWLVPGNNPTGLEWPKRWFAGACGEIAVRMWAERRGLRYEETSNTEGHADVQDFIFPFKDGRECRVNVKCTLSKRAFNLMQPIEQFEKHTEHDVLLGATGEDNGEVVVVLLWGIIPRVQFGEKAEWIRDPKQSRLVHVPSLVFPLEDLPFSMEKFYRNIKRVKR